MSARLVKEWVSPSGERKVRLYEREDKRFSFEEIYKDIDEYVGPYWHPGYESGLFADAVSAEAELMAITPWLRAILG